MILIISTCKEKLHEKEFVEPIETILKDSGKKHFTRHYTNIKKGDLQNAKKIIITGTSLQDNEYLNNLETFSYLRGKETLLKQTPILGICAGMQILTLVEYLGQEVGNLNVKANFANIQKKQLEIGYFKEEFKQEFLGLQGKQEVYHLHQNTFKIPKNYETYTLSKTPQAIKHTEKPWYATLFHPEVRNKELIQTFAELT